MISSKCWQPFLSLLVCNVEDRSSGDRSTKLQVHSRKQSVENTSVRGSSCFDVFNVTRAVLETLPSHMHLVAWWSQRVVTASSCEVAAHAATFCSLVRRLNELVNLWKRFKCLVMFLNPYPAKFYLFLLLCCLVFRLCERPYLVSRLCERPWFPVSARDVVGPDSANKPRSVVKFCDILSLLAFSLHA